MQRAERIRVLLREMNFKGLNLIRHLIKILPKRRPFVIYLGFLAKVANEKVLDDHLMRMLYVAKKSSKVEIFLYCFKIRIKKRNNSLVILLVVKKNMKLDNKLVVNNENIVRCIWIRFSGTHFALVIYACCENI